MVVRVGLLIGLFTVLTACGLGIGESGLACQDPPAADEVLGDREVPPITGLSAEEASAALEAAGIRPSWRYSYGTSMNGNAGYSECWCVPPPDGEVGDVAGTPNEQLIVFVERDGPLIGGRPQPRIGWGCEGEGRQIGDASPA